uniref:Uncharacterized protein n=1 Tax=Oryza nivara TaxID=4536 RepID=A0A0E0ISP8_ORYNI
MAASGARAVVLFAIQLLLLTFAIIGGGLLVRPAAAAAADANVDIGGAGRGSIHGPGYVGGAPPPVATRVSVRGGGGGTIGRGH